MQENLDSLEERIDASKSTGARLIYLDGRKRELTQSAEKAEKDAAVIKEELDTYERFSIKQAYRKCVKTKREAEELEAQREKLCDASATGGVHIYKSEYTERLRAYQSELKIATARYEDARTEMEAARKKLGDMNEKLAVFERFGSVEKRDALVHKVEEDKKALSSRKTVSLIGLIGTAVFASLFVASFIIGESGSAAIKTVFAVLAALCALF